MSKQPKQSVSVVPQKKAPPVSPPCTVICRFTVKPDCEKAFLKVLSRDWPGLLKMGLATKDEPMVYRHVDETGGPVYFQIFTWTSADAAQRAHSNPAVMASWTAMDPLTEQRGDHKKWEFPHVETVSMNWVRSGAFRL